MNLYRIFFLTFLFNLLFSQKILIPMDLEQNNHLKAYGIAFYALKKCDMSRAIVSDVLTEVVLDVDFSHCEKYFLSETHSNRKNREGKHNSNIQNTKKFACGALKIYLSLIYNIFRIKSYVFENVKNNAVPY